MKDRAYTLAEIDSMRTAMNVLRHTNTVMSPQDHAMIEDQLRTYLAAGVEPEELQNAAMAHAETMVRRQAKVGSAAVNRGGEYKWMA